MKTKRPIRFFMAAVIVLTLLVVVGLTFQKELSAWATAARTSEETPHSVHNHSLQAGKATGNKGTAEEERPILYWYDPMHPGYRSEKPGKAPDCGMDLVPKYADEAEGMQNMAPGTVMLSPEKQQLIGVRTTEVRREHLARTIRTTGMVVVDETRRRHIHVKVEGWVDKVYVDFVGKLVKRGEPLLTLYSPELVSTQREYLLALRGKEQLGRSSYREIADGAKSLLRATRDRLRLWDISEEQIEKLEQTGEVSRTMTLYSPITGFVMRRNLYEQQYVKPDTQLYEIADLSTIWVEADIYEYELPHVQVGQAAVMQLSYAPGKTYRGRVTYLYPTLDDKSRTARVRLEFPNPDLALKPGMFTDVDLKIDYGTAVVVPSEAVLDSGTRRVVFIAKNDGYFEPREIQVGPQVNGKTLVLSGLKAGETVVTSGNFLIDSESRLSSAIGEPSHEH